MSERKKLKILIAAMSLDIGGAETHVKELALELVRRGHDVTIASSGGMHVEELTFAGVNHYYAPLHTRRPRDMAQALGTLSFLMKNDKYDIVHAHARIPAFLCGLLRRKYKFNFVTTAHWVFASKGLEGRLTTWGDRVLAVSEDIKTYLMEKYRLDESRITVTVNGIDTERFSPGVSGGKVRSELKIPSRAPVIVCTARLDKTESAPTVMVRALLDSASELAAHVPGLCIIIAGGGDDETRYFEQARVINLNIGRNLVFMTGTRSDIDRILAAGDLFVGVSRSAMEAMSTGLPVILAGSEGYLGLFNEDILPDAVKTNFTCRGIGETVPSRLADDIAAFFADFGKPIYEGRSAKLGLFSRDTIVKMYSVTRMVDDCERVYEVFDTPVSKRTPRVLMSGYYGFGNAGDEAIMQTVHNRVSEAVPGVSITVMSKNPGTTTERYGFRAAARFNPFRIVWEILRCDALVFGGGSLLQDHTSTRSLLYYLTVLRLARLFRRPVMIYANGIGPVTKPKNQKRVALAVKKADIVTLRDERSLEDLRAMGVSREDIEVTGDPVYTIELPEENECEALCRGHGLDPASPFIAVSVRRYPGGESFFHELATLCDKIADELSCKIVFIPMQLSGDLEASAFVKSQMSADAIVPEREFTPRELLAVLGAARFAVSMRLHTLIFSARVGTPSMGIIVDPKILASLEAIGMPDIGTPQDCTSERAMEVARDLFARRDELSALLQGQSAAQGERAMRDAELLAELLKGR